jgi:hypothetical protein
MSNDDQDEIMDDSFSFFAEELIKSIFDYQLGRIFNNKEGPVFILPKESDNYLGKEVIKILEAEIPIAETQIQIINCETRTQIKILVEMEGKENEYYNLDGKSKIDVGILIEYKFINDKAKPQKKIIPFEVKTGENGLNKAKFKEWIVSPEIDKTKSMPYLKGNMLGYLSRTPILDAQAKSKPIKLLEASEKIPITNKFGLIIREKIYMCLKDGVQPLLFGKEGNDKNSESEQYDLFRTNHTFFGLEEIFKEFADEYFSNEYPEAVLYHTLENVLESDQKNEYKDIDIKKIKESKTRKTKDAFNKFVHQFLNTMETDFYKVWIDTK